MVEGTGKQKRVLDTPEQIEEIRSTFMRKINSANKYPANHKLSIANYQEILRRNGASVTNTQKDTVYKTFFGQNPRKPSKFILSSMKAALEDGRSSKFRLGMTVTQRAEAAVERKK